MVKASIPLTKRKQPTRTSLKHASGKRITAFGKLGGKVATKLAAKVFKQKIASGSTPADWPKNWIVDDRWCSYLPSDWTPALKKTENRLLIVGYVGPVPERKHLFHKKDVEKYLGRTLSLGERGPKPPEITCGSFDPKMFIQRLPVSALSDYINDRLEKLHGLSVEEAMNLTYFHGAQKKEKRYACTDLRYDIGSNRLALVASRPSQSSKPNVLPATPKPHHTPGTPARRSASSAPLTPAAAAVGARARLRACAPTTPGLPPMIPATPAQGAPATPGCSTTAMPGRNVPATPGMRRTSAAPSTPAKQLRKSGTARSAEVSISSSSSKCGSSPAAVFRACYAPLHTRAAKGFEDQKAILAIQGVGFILGLDGVMLRSVPEILSKEPAERGDFGSFVLQQFEKHIGKA